MHEELPTMAEHSFGEKVEPQVVTYNPTYAILLGLRHFGWLTLAQCQLRVFSWSTEYINQPPKCYATVVQDTILDMEEIGLVRIVWTEGEEPKIKEVHETTTRYSKRYDSCPNPGDAKPSARKTSPYPQLLVKAV